MVLIIRNNRLQTRRHNKINQLLPCIIAKASKNPKDQIPIEREKLNMPSHIKILNTFFLYSLAMFTLPFLTFFGVKHIMTVEFHADPFVANCFSAISAVIVVNLVIGFYAYHALHEPEPKPDDSEESTDLIDSTDDKKKD